MKSINIFNRAKSKKILTTEEVLKNEYKGKKSQKAIDQAQKTVAANYIFNKEKYIDFNSNLEVFKSSRANNQIERYSYTDGIEKKMERLKPMFSFVSNIKDHLKANQTGNETIANAIELNRTMNLARNTNKSNSTIQSMKDTYQAFKEADSFFTFDTETLSGTGLTGHNELDALQEIAFRKFKKVGDGVEEVVEDRVETLIGLSDAQFKHYEKELLKDFDQYGYKGNQKYSVIAGRFAKLGHKDTVINYDNYGIAITESFASDSSKNLMSKENIQRGLERARQIGIKQEKEVLENGMKVWEDQLLRSTNLFKNEFVAGFNSTKFDFEKMNQELAKVWGGMGSNQKAEYSKILGLSNGITPTIVTGNNNYLDLLDVARTAAGVTGKTGLYDGASGVNSLREINKMGKTILQQESLGAVFNSVEAHTAAHTAGADVTVLANLMHGKNSFYDQTMDIINKKVDVVSRAIDYNSVLMAKEGNSFNDYNRNGAINFVTDTSTGGIRTFSGLSFEKDGTRNLKQFGRAGGIKKNVTYKVDFMGEIDLTEDAIKSMGDVYQDFAQGKLWVTTFSPVLNQNMLDGNTIPTDPITYMFTSKEQQEGFMSGHFDHIGNLKGGKVVDLEGEELKEFNKLYSVHNIVNGKLSSPKTISANALVNEATRQATNDPAARVVRNNEYVKANKFANVQDYLISQGADTPKAQKAMLSLSTAQSIANGETLRIKHDVLNILGFQNINTGNQELYQSTLNNTINSYLYNASNRPVTDLLRANVESFGNISQEQQQIIFDASMRQVREDAVNARIAKNAKNPNYDEKLKVYAKDLDYFDFEMEDGYFKELGRKTVNSDVDNVLRVNLKSDGEYGLVNNLIKRRKGDDPRFKTKNARESYGMAELNSFMKEVNSSENYRGMFTDLLLEDTKGISVDSMAEKVVMTIRGFRENNPTAGLTVDRIRQNVLNEDKLLENLSEDFVRESILKSNGKLAQLTVFDSYNEEALKSTVNKIIDTSLMPQVFDASGVKVTDPREIALMAQKMYGYNDTTTDIMATNLRLAREAYSEHITSFVKGVTEGNGLITMNNSTGELGMRVGTKDNLLYGIPKLEMANGSFYLKTGKNKVAADMKIDVMGAVKNGNLDKSGVGLKSVLNDYLKPMKYTKNAIERATDKNLDVSNAIIGVVSNVAKNARGGSGFGSFTVKDSYSAQRVSFNDVILGIPYMMDDITQYNGWKDDRFVEILRNNVQSLKEGRIAPEVREAVAKNITDLTQIAAGIGAGVSTPSNTDLGLILKNSNAYAKAGLVAEGTFLAGEYTPTGLSHYDNPARPPITSADEIMYSKEKVMKAINNPRNGLKGKVSPGSRIVSPRENAGKSIDGIGEVVTSFTYKNANISERGFKKIVNDELDERAKKVNSKDGALNLEAIRSQLNGYNLTEQGKILDGRLAEALLDDTETKIISTQENFIRDLAKNTEVMNTRTRKAMPTIKLDKNGNIVFKPGATSYVKRGDPLLLKEAYGGITDVIGTIEDGATFGFRYNAKGTNLEVNNETINKLLNKRRADLINNNGSIDTQKAMELLGANFDGVFFTKNAYIKGYNKGTIEYGEKGMYNATLSVAGSFNNNVPKLLKTVGMEEGIGKILGKDAISEIKERFKGLTPEQQRAIGLGSTWGEVRDAIEHEKYLVGDFLRSIDAFGNALAFTNDNTGKHKNAGIASKYFVNNLVQAIQTQDGLSYDNAAQKAIEILKENNVFEGDNISFKDGKIITSKGEDVLSSRINIGAVESISNKYNLYGADSEFSIRDKDGNVIGRHTTVATVFNQDFSGTSRSSRGIGQKKSEIKELRKELNGMNRFTDPEGYSMAEERLKGLEYEFMTLNKNHKTMTISSRERDLLSIYEYDEAKINNLKNIFGESHSNIFGGMLDQDGNLKAEYNGRKIFQGAIDNLDGMVQQQAAENKGIFDQTRTAINYNKSPGSHSRSIGSKGFEDVDIKDLVFPEGENSKFLENDANRSFGRNMLVATGLKGENAYIAVPKANYNITGETIQSDEVQSALKGLNSAVTMLEDGKLGINGVLKEGVTIESLTQNVERAANNLKSSVSQSMNKLLGGLDTIQLDGYAYEKAGLAAVDPEMLKNTVVDGKFDPSKWRGHSGYLSAEVDGTSLGEWASKGVHFDAEWHGDSHFRDLGYFDEEVWRGKYELNSVDEMKEYLSKHGTDNKSLRTPSLMEGSMGMSKAYYSAGMKDGESASTLSLMFARNQDQDGDSIIKAEESYKGWTSVDYGMAKQQGQAIPEDVSKYYDELHSAQAYRAATVSASIYNNKAKAVFDKEDESAINNSNAIHIMDKSSLDGKHVTSYIDTKLDPAVTNAQLSKYSELQTITANRLGLGEEDFINMNRRERHNALQETISQMGENDSRLFSSALDFKEIYDKTEAVTMSKTAGKVSIGLINSPLAGLRRTSDILGFNSEQKSHINAISYILEEGIISKKHDDDIEITSAKEFRSSLQEMFNGKVEGANNVNRMINERYAQEIIGHIRTNSDIDYSGISDDEILQRATGTMMDIAIGAKENPNFSNIIKAENAKNSLTSRNMESVLGGYSELSTGFNASVARGLGLSGETSRNTSINLDDFEISDKGASNAVKEVAEEVMESAAKMKGSGLAKSVLGMAGAIMAAGYIGGNPTIAPGTEAQELDNYDSLQDEDLSIQRLPQGTGQGYVININAQSERGQDHAIQAIQKAMHSSVPTDINIAMTMGENKSSITSRYIDKILSGVL